MLIEKGDVNIDVNKNYLCINLFLLVIIGCQPVQTPDIDINAIIGETVSARLTETAQSKLITQQQLDINATMTEIIRGAVKWALTEAAFVEPTVSAETTPQLQPRKIPQRQFQLTCQPSLPPAHRRVLQFQQ